jgi:hypothetical protein
MHRGYAELSVAAATLAVREVQVLNQTLDLTDASVTVALLESPVWRVRSVERLDVDSAYLYRRRRSLQCGPLREVLPANVASAGPDRGAAAARLVLPVALLPKGPLLDLDVLGPGGGEGHLLVRSAIAEREAEFVLRAAQQAGWAQPSPDLRRAVVELIAFSEGPWRATQRPWRTRGRRLRAYLADEVERTDLPVVLDQLAGLSRRCRAATAGRELGAWKGLNPVAEPLLIYPGLRQDDWSHPRAMGALRAYAGLLEHLHAASLHSSEPADAALNALVDFGRYWWLMADLEVPLDSAFLVKYEERDALSMRRWHRLRFDLVTGDCGSNHVTLRILDAGATLIRPRACLPGRREPARLITTSEKTKELHSFYAWDDDRPERIDLRARVELLPRVRVAGALLAVLVYGVGTLLLLRQPATLSELALTVAPAGLAASLLSSREPSTLGSRLRRLTTLVAVLGLAALLVVAVWRAGPVLDDSTSNNQNVEAQRS